MQGWPIHPVKRCCAIDTYEAILLAMATPVGRLVFHLVIEIRTIDIRFGQLSEHQGDVHESGAGETSDQSIKTPNETENWLDKGWRPPEK